jgi:DNA-binding NarL/FixJ family response regulator
MSDSGPVATAVVIAADLDIRVLLRGLLRLHHFRVVGEAETEAEAVQLVRSQHPNLLVLDTNIANGSVATLLASVRRVSPDIRSVVVTQDSHTSTLEGPSGPSAVLKRPFRVRDFAEAVGASPPTPG